MKNTYLKIEFPSRKEDATLVHKMIMDFLSNRFSINRFQEDIEAMLREALDNCVCHAYPNGNGQIFVQVAFLENSNVLEFVVKDKGVGIENVEQAMEPFYTTDDMEEHSGLGFTIMQAFATKLKVKSIPGKGTTICMKMKLG